jgi:hypothetical protein
MAKKAVGFGLVAGAIGFEPLDNIGIETHGDGRLFRTIKLADFGAAPINDGRRIRKINVRVVSGDRRPILATSTRCWGKIALLSFFLFYLD